MKEYFKITTNQKGGYNISIGTGKTFRAETLQYVANALKHYFQEGLLNKPFDYNKHIEHSKECSCCPLCDQIEQFRDKE